MEQAVEQVQPVNINISVRVDSPGDNGAVTQINEAVFAPLPGHAPAETRYQEPDQQYQDAPATDETSVAPAGPDNPGPGGRDDRRIPDDSWNWTWTWSCGDVMPPEIVLPEEYLQQIWNWNWTWNCGGNTSTNGNSETQLPPQYQPVTSQYQPINVNVSIRIASPGNDGPVVQTNLALAMATVVQVLQGRAANHPPPLPLAGLPAPAGSMGTSVGTSVGMPVGTTEVDAMILGQPLVSSDAESAPRRWRSARWEAAGRPARPRASLDPPARARAGTTPHRREHRRRRSGTGLGSGDCGAGAPGPRGRSGSTRESARAASDARTHARSCRIASPPAQSATRASARWARPGPTARRSSSSSSLSRSSSLSPMPLGVSPRSGKPRPRTPAVGAKNRASAPLLQFLSSGRLPARKCFGRRRD